MTDRPGLPERPGLLSNPLLIRLMIAIFLITLLGAGIGIWKMATSGADDPGSGQPPSLTSTTP
jgi:hypothetical protein